VHEVPVSLKTNETKLQGPYIPLKINFLLSANFNGKSSMGIISLRQRAGESDRKDLI
jgi:hypothetical protein